MRCKDVGCPDLRGVMVTPSEQSFLMLEANVRMLTKSDKGQKHDSQWNVLATLCQVPVLAFMFYSCSHRAESQNVRTDPHPIRVV